MEKGFEIEKIKEIEIKQGKPKIPKTTFNAIEKSGIPE